WLISPCWTGVSSAQTRFAAGAGPTSGGVVASPRLSDGFIAASMTMWSDVPPVSVLPVSPALPRMSADLALQTYHQRVTRQSAELASYSAIALVRVALPDTSQQGVSLLGGTFTAPTALKFRTFRYTSDGFGICKVRH